MSEVLKRIARETLREVGDVPALIRHESAGMSVFIPDYYIQRLKLTNNKLYDEIFIEPQWGFYVLHYGDDSYYVIRIRTGVRMGKKFERNISTMVEYTALTIYQKTFWMMFHYSLIN